MKILIIEDDDTIRNGLKFYLEQENFAVIDADTATTALTLIENNLDLNIILLDINLPDKDGFDLFKDIKKIKDFPIIFLTANDLEVSVVRGLDMGADDYITKPFKARELVSRIKNVLRRVNNSQDNNIITIRDICIDLKQAKVFKKGIDAMLTALEYKILLTLALNPNTVFTREKILADIWDVNEDYVNDNTLTVYVKRIREKLEDDITDPKIIITVRGIGYRLGEADVKE
ncbi:MAG: response regulator transcription factor [Bacilli bacterium]|nr:response regulator transcription factor [Bacilli bacterium]MCI9433794.1 response regulator transcription factor [Bacilli bacterium]